MNYFASAAAANRYALGRPDVHARSVDQIRAFLRLDGPLDTALDVACGTGLSTGVLRAIASQVYGTDISSDMLRLAVPVDGVFFVKAPAEDLPFGDGVFDIVTVSSGVHWFDIDAFLTEARRVLREGGWLVLYDNNFDFPLGPDDAFRQWCASVHFQRYPSPPRNNKYDWRKPSQGFVLVEELTSSYTLTMTRLQLAQYLTTHSNVIARIEAGETTFEAAEALLLEELTPFFPQETREIYFGHWIKFIRKV